MTDTERLNRLMAEAMGWERKNDFAYWDPKRKLWVHTIEEWQPAVRIEQAIMVYEEVLRKRGWTGNLFMLLDGYHMELTYRVDGISMDKHIVGPYAKEAAEALCLAVKAARKEEHDAG